MDITMSKEIDAAVAWWTDQLRDHAGRMVRNIGQAMTISERAAMVVASTGDTTAAETEMIERFGQALRRLIEERVSDRPPVRKPDDFYWVGAQINLSVDYEPQFLLLDAWEAAGGEQSTSILFFPHKTTMRLNPGLVTVGRTVVYSDA